MNGTDIWVMATLNYSTMIPQTSVFTNAYCEGARPVKIENYGCRQVSHEPEFSLTARRGLVWVPLVHISVFT